MPYKYPKLDSYEFLAAGKVLYGYPGSPNFPVRLAQEIFLRAQEHLGIEEEMRLYDPCCGTGYLLSTLALLNPEKIQSIHGSDIQAQFLEIARKNFSLLTQEGLKKRKEELQHLYKLHQKETHANALSHLEHIQGILTDYSPKIEGGVFERDILVYSENANATHVTAHLILADVPYGNLVEWKGENSLGKMMENLMDNLHETGILALIYPKAQAPKHPDFNRVEKFKIGKRVIELFKRRD